MPMPIVLMVPVLIDVPSAMKLYIDDPMYLPTNIIIASVAGSHRRMLMVSQVAATKVH